MIIEVNPNKKNKICSPVIGFEAENKVTGFEFDYSDWAADIGDGYLTLSVKRPTDTIPYPVSLTQTGTHKATWTVSSTDVAFAGRGEVQLTYIVDDKVKKSAIYEILIDRSLEPDGDIPDPYISWFEELLQVSVQVEADADRAEAAADSIKNLEAVAVTLPSGESATAEYDPETGVMSFGIPKGDKGDAGETGATGNGISSTVLNADYTLTINFTDGTSYTTPSIRGEQGIQGETGEAGNGIASTVLNPDYTLTITFTNGTTYTTPSIRGPEGAQGQTGPTGNGIDNVTMDASGYLTITFTNGTVWTSPTSLFGPVQDVKVNGESVVDENGVANITVPIITKTVSGNPIVLDDADGAVQALSVDLLPVQEGTPWIDSDVYKEPYLFKACPQLSNDYNSELLDKIVGGTVAWNQLAQAINSTSYRNQYATVSYNNGVVSVSDPTARYSGIHGNTMATKPSAGNKLLLSYDVKTNWAGTSPAIYYNNGYWQGGKSKKVSANTWTNISTIINVARGSANTDSINLQDDNAEFSGHAFEAKNMMAIDLTQMFGSTIADYIYSLEQANAGAGVAWFKKLFPKDYYAYNAGQLLSVKTSAHQMVGFNQLDPANTKVGGAYNPTVGNTINLNSTGATYTGTNPIEINVTTAWRGCCLISEPLVAGQQYEVAFKTSAPTTAAKRISQYLIDADNKVITSPYNWVGNIGDNVVRTFTPTKSGLRCAVTIQSTSAQKITVTDPCVHLRWDGERDGDYEAYKKWTYPLDSDLELRGIPKLDSANNLYYDGDEYEADGTVNRRFGIVDLGTLTWLKLTNATKTYFQSQIEIADMKKSTGNNNLQPILSAKYQTETWGHTLDAEGYNKCICEGYKDKSYLAIYDEAYTNLTAADFKTAMSGVYLVYELATPTTETVTGFTSPQAVGSTESYTDNRAVPIPVGHESTYANIYPITGYDNTIITDSNGTDTTTTTVTLPHTVYGADVDVTGGASKETWANISSYNGETISEPWLSSMDEYVQGTTPTTGAQVTYKLATPTDLQTTPTEVELYKGDNVVSGDGTMELTYVRNLQMVIDKIESAL